MARIVYAHPRRTKYYYHIYTDLDFWDAFRLLRDLAAVRRNFGQIPSGDEFPTQVIAENPDCFSREKLERRLKRAVVSPPRHVIVRSVLTEGSFEFDPVRYYPERWTQSRMLHFTLCRLPLDQTALSTPYRTIRLSWCDEKIRIDRIQRNQKFDPVIRDKKEAIKRLKVPSCF